MSGGTLEACPGAAPVGATVTLTGTNCGYPGAEAIIYFGSAFDPAGVALNVLGSIELGRFKPDGSGSFGTTFTVPSELRPIQGSGGGSVVPGRYRIYSKPEGLCGTSFDVTSTVTPAPRPGDLPQCPTGQVPQLEVSHPPAPGDQPGTGAASAEEAFRKLPPTSTKFSMYPFGSTQPTRDAAQLGREPVWIVDAPDLYIALYFGVAGQNNWFVYPARFVGCDPANDPRTPPPSPAPRSP